MDDSQERPVCPKCNASDIRKAGMVHLAKESKQRWACKVCGLLFTDRTIQALRDVPKLPSAEECAAKWEEYVGAEKAHVTSEQAEVVDWWTRLILEARDPVFWLGRAEEWFSNTVLRR